MVHKDDVDGRKANATRKSLDIWDLPPTWFGFGLGMMLGAGLGGAGAGPWYRAPLVMLAGFCVALATLLAVRARRKRQASGPPSPNRPNQGEGL